MELGFFGRFERNEVKIRAFYRRRRNALIDAGGLVGDVVVARLSKDVLQAHTWNARTLQQIVEHVAGANTRQLVGVANKDDAGGFGNGVQKRGGKPGVNHTEFVDDEQVAVELVEFVLVEFFGDGVDIEQAVNGVGLFAAAVAHALGRAARRGGEQNVFAHFAGEVKDSLENRRLAGAWATGNDANLVCGGKANRFALHRVKAEFMFAFPVDEFALEAVSRQLVFVESALDDFGDFLLRVIERRVKAVFAVALDAARFANALELLQQILDGVIIGDVDAQILERAAD